MDTLGKNDIDYKYNYLKSGYTVKLIFQICQKNKFPKLQHKIQSRNHETDI